jgi:hypothetical protein
MEHAKSTVSASQMYEFVQQIHPSDLGILHHYKKQQANPDTKKKRLSVRMQKLCTRVLKNCPYMLDDIPGSPVHMFQSFPI